MHSCTPRKWLHIEFVLSSFFKKVNCYHEFKNSFIFCVVSRFRSLIWSNEYCLFLKYKYEEKKATQKSSTLVRINPALHSRKAKARVCVRYAFHNSGGAAIVVVASVDAYTCSSYIALRRTAAVPLLRRQLPAALEEIRAPTRPATQGKAKQIIECDWIEEW